MKDKVWWNEEFYSLPFFVDTRVLTPRNETEILVDQALFFLKNHPIDVYIDVGTGSGCIPMSVMRNTKISIWSVFAVDISLDALEVAKKNISFHALKADIQLLHSNLLDIFLQKNDIFLGKNLLLTANLPYIKNNDFEHMDQEVLENDPHISLFWWEMTGFELYEVLIDQIFSLKELYHLDKIIAFFEIWFDQYEYSKNYLEKKWLKFEYFKDYSNIYRVIQVEW